jgi:tubulin-specific chaperone A
LKIKSSAVKRTTKEYLYYFKEKDQEDTKLQKMRDSGGDPYDIKQQENVVQESAVMIPATKKSLESRLADLRGFLEELGELYEGAGKEKDETDDIMRAADEAVNAGG